MIDRPVSTKPRLTVDWLRLPALVVAAFVIGGLGFDYLLPSDAERWPTWGVALVLAHTLPYVLPWSLFSNAGSSIALRLWLLAAATSLSVWLFLSDVTVFPPWQAVAVSASAWMAVWVGWRRPRPTARLVLSDTHLRVVGWTCGAGVICAGALWLADGPYATLFGIVALGVLMVPLGIMDTMMDEDRRLTPAEKKEWRHAASFGLFAVIAGFFFLFRQAPRGRRRRGSR